MFCTKCGAQVSGGFCVHCGTPVQQPSSAQPPAVPPAPRVPMEAGMAAAPVMTLSWDYATWGTRVLGYIVDALLVTVVAAVLFLVAGALFGGIASLGGGVGSEGLQGLGTLGCCFVLALFPVSTLLVGLWNKVYLVAQRGSSIGQGVVKIKVVNAQGQLLTQGQALIRLLAHVGLSFVPFGGIVDLLWPLWDERRQTLHDKAVGCYVVTVGR